MASKSSRALLKLVTGEDPPGDAELTKQRAAEWSAGQKLCRRRKRHNWRRFNSVVYGDDMNRPGTRINIIERCPDCKNEREADHVVTNQGGRNRGLRQATDWKMVYRDVHGTPYLLEKGSQPVSDELRESIYAEEFFAHSGRVIYVDDQDAD